MAFSLFACVLYLGGHSAQTEAFRAPLAWERFHACRALLLNGLLPLAPAAAAAFTGVAAAAWTTAIGILSTVDQL